MRAAQYVGDGTISVGEATVTPPGPGQVQLAVSFTGICGTDLHIQHGAMDARVRLPAVLGHEMSGRIAALGAGVSRWQVGDPVTVMPLAWCGECPACRAGNQHICQRLNFMGIDSPGSMQPLWTVPASVLVALPATVSMEHAALVEPVAVAVHDVRRAALTAGEQAVVVGGGPIGLLVASVARTAGADVVVLETNPGRAALVAATGLTTLDPSTTDVAGYVQDWTKGAGAAVSFEVSGSQPGLNVAVDVLAVRGRVVVVAIHPQPRPVNLQQIFWRELTLIGARVYQRADFERAVVLVADGRVPVDSLISHVVPLTSAPDAFTALASGEVMKVLIDCGGGI